jgi:hypothetical protein
MFPYRHPVEAVAVYRAVPRAEIAERIAHLRDLFRATHPASDVERLAHEKREIVTKHLLSNLVRTKEHPTLSAVLDVAEIFSLTIDGAHRLFGYGLDNIRNYDRLLNGGRTHIVESYPFNRDFPVDLPLVLGERDAFASHATLHALVLEWQTNLPIRTLQNDGWRARGSFYAHVGTEDSLGSSLPPGSTALVEPISTEEAQHPNPRATYFLQFGNGYQCSRCVVTQGRLIVLPSDRRYKGPREFLYPGTVRIAGRVRMFTLSLPAPIYLDVGPLPSSSQGAPLILPWEHGSRDLLFSAKHRRFARSKLERTRLQAAFDTVFGSHLASRTERRYRRPSASQPHVDTLIQMVITNSTRYSDALRAGGSLASDRRGFSLETLLSARRIADVFDSPRKARVPQPVELWQELRKVYPEWPTPLSMTFPHLSSLGNRIFHLPRGADIQGVTPAISPGSFLLLENTPLADLDQKEQTKARGWHRPIYALQKGAEMICGYLHVDHDRFALTHDPHGNEPSITFDKNEISQLSRLGGIAVPV